MFSNLKKIFSSKMRIFAYIILVLILLSLWWYFTDITIMFGNYGNIHTSLDICLSLVMIFGFPIFIIGMYHKSILFGTKSLDKKSGTGLAGGILGTLISGASCCGATLATYVGLIPLMTLLPYDGLELKLIGALGLLYALYDIMKNLETCKVRK